MRLLLGRKTLRRLLEEADVSVRLNEMTGDGEWAEGATRLQHQADRSLEPVLPLAGTFLSLSTNPENAA